VRYGRGRGSIGPERLSDPIYCNRRTRNPCLIHLDYGLSRCFQNLCHVSFSHWKGLEFCTELESIFRESRG